MPGVGARPAMMEEAVAAGPGLSRDLALKTALRTQLDAVLAGTAVPSRQPPRARWAAAHSTVSPTVHRTREMERDLGRQAVRSQREPSFAPIAGADVTPAHGRPVRGSEPVFDGPPSGEFGGGILNLVGDAPQEGPSGEVGYRKQAEASVAPGRRFSVQKQPGEAKAAEGLKASEPVSSQASRAARRMRVEVSSAPAPLPPASEVEQPGRALARPPSERIEPGGGPWTGTERPPRAWFVPDRTAAAVLRQVQATLAQVNAGLLPVAPATWPAEPAWEMGRSRDQVVAGTAPGLPAAPAMGEIEQRLASIGGQAGTPAMRRGRRDTPSPVATGDWPAVAGPLSEEALVEVVTQLAEMVGQLQRQVQQLATAVAAVTGRSLGGAAHQGQEPEAEGDPQALSRKLAKQLVDEARRYGIRM
jgi:hypothetical protein